MESERTTSFGIKVVIACFALVVAAGVYSVFKIAYVAYTFETPDPDRARFMLECTYDWMLSPKECREILNGKDPVTPPPEAGC